MTETELRIAGLELRIGDVDLVMQMWMDNRIVLLVEQVHEFHDTLSRLKEKLRCLKQSLPQRQSE